MSETTSVGASPELVVELRGVRKSFGGVHALRGVDLAVPTNSVVGLAGENGAGKSTLLKILSGVYTPDAGEIVIDGVPRSALSPADARDAGIGMVAQELSLFGHLSVAENILAGQEPRRGPFVDRGERRRRAQAALDRAGTDVSPDAMVRDLSYAQRQLVEIAKALVSSPRVLILDEPTSALREQEVRSLLATILSLKASGCSIIFITHRMSEMFAVCDRFTVLKDGESVATREADAVTADELVRLMVGRELTALYPPKPDLSGESDGDVLLAVSQFAVQGSQVSGVDLEVRSGEIVGVAGMAGNGQNELLEGIAGVRRSRGVVTAGRYRGPFSHPRKALAAGVSFVPEDRKTQGLVLPFSVRNNLTLSNLRNISRGGMIRTGVEQSLASSLIETLHIRPPDPSLAVHGLSGGNQQKVVIGKSLMTEPSVYILADPTRGIDVGTKHEIFVLLRQLASQKKGVMLLSTDLTEIVGVCDRVLVMFRGRIVAELSGDDLTEENVTRASFGEQVTA